MGFLIPGSLVRVQPGVLKSTGKPVPFSFQVRQSFVATTPILKNPQICTGRRSLGDGVGLVFGTRQQPARSCPLGGHGRRANIDLRGPRAQLLPKGINGRERPVSAGRQSAGPSASPRLAVLLSQLLRDFAHQRPVPGSNRVPKPLLENGGRGVLVAKGSGDLRRHREAESLVHGIARSPELKILRLALQHVCVALNVEGRPTRSGKPWTKQVVNKVLGRGSGVRT